LWSTLTKNEQIYFLKIIHQIQSNPEKAPSDSCAFLPNMTMRLYAFVSRPYTTPIHHNRIFESFLKKIASNRRIPEKKQLITRKMIQALDGNLIEQINNMKTDNSISPRDFFLL
jgi:hypothetical protein